MTHSALLLVRAPWLSSGHFEIAAAMKERPVARGLEFVCLGEARVSQSSPVLEPASIRA